ncbi:MAG: ABC transporter permease [Woeseiaceae bacterium]
MRSGALSGAGIEARRALRGLAASPGFSVGIVLVLGVAIAGLTTIATAAYDLFLRPLPFAQSERLAHVTVHSRTMGFDIGVSPPMFAEILEESAVADVAAYQPSSTVRSLSGDEWRTAAVSHNLADVLGVVPIIGRSFTQADGESGAPPVALISETAWRNRFGGDASVIGREIRLQEGPVRIVGVMPAAFSIPSTATELWQPQRFTPAELAPDAINNFAGGTLVALLEPGVPASRVAEVLNTRYDRDERLNARRIKEVMGHEFRVRGFREAWTAEQREPLAIIGLASLLVFASALFNIAGLWLTRLLARSHEHAVETALGAGGLRRLARTLFEFVLLGGAGAGLALALTPLALGWLEDLGALSPDQPLPVDPGPATIAIALVVLAAGGIPVLLAAAAQQRRQRRVLVADLSSGGYGRARSGARSRRVFIVAQVAMAMSLTCAMGLLLRSWHGLLTEDLGFEPQKLLVARINGPAEAGYRPDPGVAAALEELSGLPGVTAVTHANVAPFARSESMSLIPIPGHEDQNISVRTSWVGERYFRATGIPLLRGRAFEAADAGTQSILVDDRFASLYFPDGDAVGQRIRWPAGPDDVVEMTIVGVAGTAKHRAPDEQPEHGTVYRFGAEPMPTTIAVIAASVPPTTLVNDVQASLERALGPERTGSVVTMESLVRLTVRDREPQLVLLATFGAETLALAGIGLFSLLAWSVRARTAEFGVRQAVGASASDIRRHVLREGLRLLAGGLAIGAVGAFVAGRLIAGRLYEVSPVDPVTWFATALLLALVVLAAGAWPAERAARIQPNEALRYE